MSADTSKERPAGGQRWILARAAGWIDARVAPLPAETVPLAAAAGRVAAEPVSAAHDLPPVDRAARDGIALRADETAGAGAYNPLTFRLVAAGGALAPGRAARIAAGDPLPTGADAVVPIELVSMVGGDACEIIEPLAAGQAVEKAGSHARRGAPLAEAGQRLGPQHLGLLAEGGVARLPVVRRPRVAVLLARASAADDIDGPMLRALIERDGGVAEAPTAIGREQAALAQALGAADADIVLVVGGTGPGDDDHAAAALADSGTLAGHGVALAPGETAGFGDTRAGAPVFLLPGTPVDCLWAYELLAGRAVRRAGLRPTALPFATRPLTAARKLVSGIGRTEVVPVRRAGDGGVEPTAGFAEAGLAAAARADGFVVIAESSEGVPAGAPVTVYLYTRGEDDQTRSR
jgi:molybdopterin molybdotransferase